MQNKKKVLGILGSPNQGGNVDLLLDQALSGAQSQGAQTRKICLTDLNIQICKGCLVCRTTGKCPVKDEMAEIYPLFSEYDAFIFASPLYHRNMSCYFKIFIDRIHGVIVEHPKGNNMPRIPIRRLSRGKRALLLASMNASWPRARGFLKCYYQSFDSFADYCGFEITGLVAIKKTWLSTPKSIEKELVKAFKKGKSLVSDETSWYKMKKYSFNDKIDGVINWTLSLIDSNS